MEYLNVDGRNGTFNRDYNARELSVQVGALVSPILVDMYGGGLRKPSLAYLGEKA